jgi:hypothetical protein
MTAKTSGIMRQQSRADRATFPETIIRVAARVVRGNKTICKGMRDETRVAQKKRMQELEDKLYELEENNKILKAELKASKKSNSKSMKGDIQNANDWTGEEANLAEKVMEFCKDFLFPCYKFLKDGWKSYKPENDKSFCYLVGWNMANTSKNMRITTTGSMVEDELSCPWKYPFMDNGGNIFILDEFLEQMNSYIQIRTCEFIIR